MCNWPSEEGREGEISILVYYPVSSLGPFNCTSIYCKMSQASNYSVFSAPQKNFGVKLMSKIWIEEGMSVLDLGCGTGYLSSKLAEKVGSTGWVLGVDPDIERIKAAQKTYGGFDSLYFEEGSTENFQKGPYDIVFSNVVLHWVSDKETAFQNVYNSLNPGGIFALGVALSHSEFFDQLMDPMDVRAKDGVYKMFHYVPAERYIELGRSYGFSLESVESFPSVSKFENIDEVINWWCEATHRKFDPKYIEKARFEELKQPHGDRPIEFMLGNVAMIILKK